MKLTNPYERLHVRHRVRPRCQDNRRRRNRQSHSFAGFGGGSEIAALRGHGWYPWHLAFKADGSVLYSAGWDGSVRRWDMATREQLPLPEGIRAAGVVAISPDGKQIAYEDDSGKLRLVELREYERATRIRIAGCWIFRA